MVASSRSPAALLLSSLVTQPPTPVSSERLPSAPAHRPSRARAHSRASVTGAAGHARPRRPSSSARPTARGTALRRGDRRGPADVDERTRRGTPHRAAPRALRRSLAPPRRSCLISQSCGCSGPLPAGRRPRGPSVGWPTAEDGHAHANQALPSRRGIHGPALGLHLRIAGRRLKPPGSAVDQRRAAEADRQRRRRRGLHRGQGRRCVRGHGLDLPERAAQRERGDDGSPGRHVREPLLHRRHPTTGTRRRATSASTRTSPSWSMSADDRRAPQRRTAPDLQRAARFKIVVDRASAGSTQFYAVWAYRAP